MIFRELLNAAFRFSLRRPGAEIMGGRSNAPPPPSRRCKIQRPSRARVKQAIFHTGMPISIHIMTIMAEALLRRRRVKKTFYYQTTPMFLMTLHSFLSSYFSHFVHFSINTKSSHWCCWIGAHQTPNFTLWTHGVIKTTRFFLATLPSLSLARCLLHISIKVTWGWYHCYCAAGEKFCVLILTVLKAAQRFRRAALCLWMAAC